jgi:hypothetical protein
MCRPEERLAQKIIFRSVKLPKLVFLQKFFGTYRGRRNGTCKRLAFGVLFIDRCFAPVVH